jgi:hypothetical protein
VFVPNSEDGTIDAINIHTESSAVAVLAIGGVKNDMKVEIHLCGDLLSQLPITRRR